MVAASNPSRFAIWYTGTPWKSVETGVPCTRSPALRYRHAPQWARSRRTGAASWAKPPMPLSSGSVEIVRMQNGEMPGPALGREGRQGEEQPEKKSPQHSFLQVLIYNEIMRSSLRAAIALASTVVPRRLRREWRAEWEVELGYRPFSGSWLHDF